MSELRSTAQRRADALALLEAHADAWLATADPHGDAHLIAVTAVWTGTDIVIATRDGSPTSRNLGLAGRARLAAGTPADVVMLDVEVTRTLPASADAGEVGVTFRDGAGWDPSEEGDDWHYFVLRPTRIQAYRGYGEQAGRDILREGRWLS